MPPHIGQGLDHDPVSGGRHLPGNRRLLGRSVQSHHHLARACEPLGELGQFGQAGLRATLRAVPFPVLAAQQVDRPVERGQGLQPGLLYPLEQSCGPHRVEGRKYGARLRLGDHAADVMGDEVVQVVGEFQSLGASGRGHRAPSALVQPAQVEPDQDRRQREDRTEAEEGQRAHRSGSVLEPGRPERDRAADRPDRDGSAPTALGPQGQDHQRQQGGEFEHADQARPALRLGPAAGGPGADRGPDRHHGGRQAHRRDPVPGPQEPPAENRRRGGQRQHLTHHRLLPASSLRIVGGLRLCRSAHFRTRFEQPRQPDRH